ncbi:hypothetical protein CEXT_622511 [Caerostris extrusa]|uniref:Uncharacterized protein n=1 Tax=Caerostris extrusa TaxID=172846 RepID=A0AAV4RGM0_CAEEX|nr:hypothetical protein CEXT_622511 [Caerostris extrusa]
MRFSSDVKQKFLGMGPENRDNKNSRETRTAFKGADRKTRCVEWSHIARNYQGSYCVQKNNSDNIIPPSDITVLIKNTKIKSVPDFDSICSKILKKFSNVTIIKLCYLINKVLEDCNYHPYTKTWKRSYEPRKLFIIFISLLSILSKITESIILNRLNQFVEPNIICKEQFDLEGTSPPPSTSKSCGMHHFWFS